MPRRYFGCGSASCSYLSRGTHKSEQRTASGSLPCSPGHWSGGERPNYPQLGEEQAFAPDANSRQTILKADELGPPEVYTITLGIFYSEQDWPGTGRAFEVEAEINFGAGGATQVVKIDWVQGAQISLPMSAVNVVATCNIDAVAAPQPPADLRPSLMLGRGPALGKSRWTDPTPFPLGQRGERAGASSVRDLLKRSPNGSSKPRALELYVTSQSNTNLRPG